VSADVAASDASWAVQISRADSGEALDRLMQLWLEAMTAGGNLARSIGFETHMELRDWESAKASIVRAYGRSSAEHRSTLDTLSAAIHQRNVLAQRRRLAGRASS
jgi:hypothetical protein